MSDSKRVAEDDEDIAGALAELGAMLERQPVDDVANKAAVEGAEWPLLPTRAEREARKHAEHLEQLAKVVRSVGGATAAGADEHLAARVVANLEAGNEARAANARTRADALQRSVHGEQDDGLPIDPDLLPQNAMPPAHIKISEKREEQALREAAGSASRVGRRELVYWPGWVRDLAKRVCESKGRALAELGALPGWARDSVLAEAKPYGGADSLPGRNMIMLSIVLWHVGGRLRGRVSGMPRQAYTSLTMGAYGMHYSHSSVWHAVHSMSDELLPESVRGPDGGRVGSGRNRGFMVAVRLAGWMRTVVPSSRALPGWMISPRGWPYVQVIVMTTDPPENTS